MEISEIHKLVWISPWIFGCFECVPSMCCLKVLLILNFTNAVLSKTTFGSIFVSQNGVLCAKGILRLGPMDLKIHSLERNPKTTTVTRQLTKSQDFGPNYLCDVYLRPHLESFAWRRFLHSSSNEIFQGFLRIFQYFLNHRILRMIIQDYTYRTHTDFHYFNIQIAPKR